ncbi:MAG TPA: hypothetical protein VHX18_02590 [Rhizomicrobium sp.]|jgi:hypothetical protein|nr:hypothetical protein [Rhizomicrobium sp.]
MRKSFPYALAAALLVTLNPVYAANLPKDDAGGRAVHKDDSATAADGVSPLVHGDDGKANVIILDPDSLQALPNPYANPAPRMVSDVWAMRT